MTIGRNHLAITDNEAAEHGPFDCCRATMDCYVLSKHMLCIFHGVILKFNENIHPLLPRTRGQHHLPLRQRKLTKSHTCTVSHVMSALFLSRTKTHRYLLSTFNGRTKKMSWTDLHTNTHLRQIFVPAEIPSLLSRSIIPTQYCPGQISD